MDKEKNFEELVAASAAINQTIKNLPGDLTPEQAKEILRMLYGIADALQET